MEYSGDILQPLADEDLPKLKELYRNVNYAPYILSFIETAMKWKSKRPDRSYITFYTIKDWEVNGTFIALLQWSCYDFVVFTLEESVEKLSEAIRLTKRFEWKTRLSLFYAVHTRHFEKVYEALNSVGAHLHPANLYDIWWMPKEKAVKLKIDIPPEVYIAKVTKEHIPKINSLWPNAYPGSEEYLSTFLEMNCAYGVFSKEDNTIASWVFKVHLGTMAALQTAEEHKGKGYGSLVTKYMAKEIAEDGHEPLGTVFVENFPSQNMFRKIGFEVLDQVRYIILGDGL